MLHISEVLEQAGLKEAIYYNRLREYRAARGALDKQREWTIVIPMCYAADAAR